jgi:transcriptional regulator with XRE-family HTH domain
MNTTQMQVPEAVRELRSALGLTQEELAAKVEAGTASVYRWEAGSVRLRPVVLVRLYKLAKEADRPDLATIFAFGQTPMVVATNDLPGFLLAEAIPAIRDYLASINTKLTRSLCDPKLDQRKRSALIGEALAVVVEAEQMVDSIGKDAKETRD